MDDRLAAWARSVKSRRRGAGLPPLWLFTDAVRSPDPLAAVARLPRGLAGVVFRPEGFQDRLGTGRRLSQLCRDRRLMLVVAGDWRLAAALRSSVHLRGGRLPAGMRRSRALTSSAHDRSELHRAARAGVRLVFLSPAFATASHPGAASLGAVRWAALAGTSAVDVAALGGMTGASVARLHRGRCAGVGAIAALVT